ncbi:hypothetical protein [Paenilisteria rocourtiae]|uniref:Uncharacterized protein n=1 Tax=Listeria rocourtiae TaxID=647910 RepID=A0A4R6ZPW2_9LIST|nr:hypothetical protein [Listeria rocourtiae]EUJ43214.1 hypothetical protein PROCOU_15674 [Listeria rocourtiae FSL F6-920]TDR54610.1 hypothetical protein DFP96_102198 [Listeria rocourtiae]
MSTENEDRYSNLMRLVYIGVKSAQWIIPIALTVGIFCITYSFTLKNSNLVLDEELTDFQMDK